MNKRKSLGRGLDALLGGAARTAAAVPQAVPQVPPASPAAPASAPAPVADAPASPAVRSSEPAAVAVPQASRPEAAADPRSGLRELPVDLLQRGRYQPRVDMREETLAELAESIR